MFGKILVIIREFPEHFRNILNKSGFVRNLPEMFRKCSEILRFFSGHFWTNPEISGFFWKFQELSGKFRNCSENFWKCSGQFRKVSGNVPDNFQKFPVKIRIFSGNLDISGNLRISPEMFRIFYGNFRKIPEKSICFPEISGTVR